MRSQHARSERRVFVLRAVGCFLKRAPKYARNVVARDAAVAQQQRLAGQTGDDGRLNSDRCYAAIDDQVDAAVEIGKHMLRGRRRNMTRAISRWGNDRSAERGEQRLRRRVNRNPHCNRSESCCREF